MKAQHASKKTNPIVSYFSYGKNSRKNTCIFNRRVLFGNIAWVVTNVILTKLGILLPEFANLLNTSAFLLTVGSIVCKNYCIGRWQTTLQIGVIIVSTALWIGSLL